MISAANRPYIDASVPVLREHGLTITKTFYHNVYTELPALTIDVSGTEVVDHAALRAIGDAYRRALRQGRRIIVRGASAQLRGALTQLHLGHHLIDDAVPPTTDDTLTL